MPVYAEIISIGDEILYGQTLDTNSHWISGRLDEIGVKVRRKITVGDEREEILNSVRESENRSDIVLITGGLGPTSDDLTKPLLTEYFQTHLKMNEDALQDIKTLFAKAGKELKEPHIQQALLPASCTKVTNMLGTAPGMWFERNGKVIVSMPGVPYEMKGMMTSIILPKLKEKYVGGVIYHKMIKTIGVSESDIAQTIKAWEERLPKHIKLAYLPSLGRVKLRITAMGDDKARLEEEVGFQVDGVLPLISKYVYGYDDDEMEKLIGQRLMENGQTIAFAESCTGGHLSQLITGVEGSSRYFKGTLVAYDYDVKVKALGVDQTVLEQQGAVSEEVVLQMAKNVREKLNADVGMAISGIAGPGGGTEEKPVGTVWIAYSDNKITTARKFNFSKDRKLNIRFAAQSALNMFRLCYSGN